MLQANGCSQTDERAFAQVTKQNAPKKEKKMEQGAAPLWRHLPAQGSHLQRKGQAEAELFAEMQSRGVAGDHLL